MSSRMLSDHFCSPAPVFRPNEIPTYPFEDELWPTNPDLIYDMDRLKDESIDNYANMLCYTIPSLSSLVFFRWVPYSSTTIDELGRMELDPVMELERVMGKHGSRNDDLYTLLPCSYGESLHVYQQLGVNEAGHRTLLEQLFKRRGVYEKYRDFVESYHLSNNYANDRVALKGVDRPSSSIIDIFKQAQITSVVKPIRHSRNNSEDSTSSDNSEQILWIKPRVHIPLFEDLTPRPNRTRFS